MYTSVKRLLNGFPLLRARDTILSFKIFLLTTPIPDDFTFGVWCRSLYDERTLFETKLLSTNPVSAYCTSKQALSLLLFLLI